jgi:hypothetical protein
MKTFLIRLASAVPRPLAHIVLGGLTGALFAPLFRHLLMQHQVSDFPQAIIAAGLGGMVASIWYVHSATHEGKDAVSPATSASGGNRIKKSTRLPLEVLCAQAPVAVPTWFVFDISAPMPLAVKIVLFAAMNVAQFIWFLQCRSADKESFTPRIWR